jgi:prepilin-type N-terminal cleavage/methylation domain-containing protein
MTRHHPIRPNNARQTGFSLIEVMFALVLLAVGLMGSIGMICVAAASNGGSKVNTTAATLAQSTMERIVAIPQGAAGNGALTSLSDCKNNTFQIDTSQSLPLGPGEQLSNGIDFHQPPVPNYSMQYVMCSGGGNVTYDVRWRVDPGPTAATQLVTVSVRSGIGAGAVATLARPITLRTLRGN